MLTQNTVGVTSIIVHARREEQRLEDLRKLESAGLGPRVGSGVGLQYQAQAGPSGRLGGSAGSPNYSTPGGSFVDAGERDNASTYHPDEVKFAKMGQDGVPLILPVIDFSKPGDPDISTRIKALTKLQGSDLQTEDEKAQQEENRRRLQLTGHDAIVGNSLPRIPLKIHFQDGGKIY